MNDVHCSSCEPSTQNKRTETTMRLVFAGILMFILVNSNVAALIPQYDKLSLGIAFITGLVASVSTCLAVTSGIIMGYTESVEKGNTMMTQMKFHGGRLLAFIVGGGILGLTASSFSGSVRTTALFSIVVGCVLLYIGLQLLRIVPNITKRGFHLPRSRSRVLFRLKDPKYARLVGAFTFLLPCGFTQSMQLFALQSGSFSTGATIMGAFALGTLPVLLGIGLGTKYIKNTLTRLNPFIASLLVVFGLYTMYSGTVLIQALNDTTQQETQNTQNQSMQSLPKETVYVGHDGTQFVPYSIKLAAGKQYRLVVTPTADGQGCMYQVVIPGKGAHTIKQGESFEITIDGSQAKTIPLVCASMGMEQGEVIISES